MKGEYLSLKTAEILARRPAEAITYETRFESNESVDKSLRYTQILECLDGKQMTAKEVAVAMFNKGYIPSTERNFTAPRLTEMSQLGIVEPIGKKKCSYSGRMVAVYEVRHG